MGKTYQSKSRRSLRHSGVAIIEFAVILPLLLLLTLGLVQYGIIMNTIDTMHQITRKSASYAALIPRKDKEIVAKVQEFCAGSTISYADLKDYNPKEHKGEKVLILPANLTERVANTPITVSITYPIAKRIFLPTEIFGIRIFAEDKEVSSTSFIEGAGLAEG